MKNEKIVCKDRNIESFSKTVKMLVSIDIWFNSTLVSYITGLAHLIECVVFYIAYNLGLYIILIITSLLIMVKLTLFCIYGVLVLINGKEVDRLYSLTLNDRQ